MGKLKSEAQATQIAKVILSPGVWEFIDQKKFTRSAICEMALKAIVNHINVHRDYTVADPWLRMFADTEYFDALRRYFSENTSLVFTAHNGIVDVRMSNIPVLGYRTFLECFVPKKATTLEGLYGQGWKLKAEANQPYVDIMDTRMRLPGSFENGERR